MVERNETARSRSAVGRGTSAAKAINSRYLVVGVWGSREDKEKILRAFSNEYLGIRDI